MAHYYTLITQANGATDLLSLAAAKKQLKMEDLGSFDDDIITACMEAAFQEAEQYLNRGLFDYTYKVQMSSWIQDFEPKKQKVRSITSVKYITTDGAEVTISNASALNAMLELVSKDDFSSIFKFKDFDNLPDLKADTYNAVEIVFNIGYDKIEFFPPAIEQAIKLLLTDNYNYRNTRQRSQSFIDSSRILLEPFRYYYHD